MTGSFTVCLMRVCFFFSSRRRHTRLQGDWSSDVCSSDLLADQIKLAFNRLDSTNRLKGVVLDLRFADGQDYSTAASLVDRFLTREQPILDWADGAIHSTAKPDAIPVPVAVLVNRQTAGAAQA